MTMRTPLLIALVAAGMCLSPASATAQFQPTPRFPRTSIMELVAPPPGPGDLSSILSLYRIIDCSEPRMQQTLVGAIGGAASIWILLGIGVLFGARVNGEVLNRFVRASAITGGVAGGSFFLMHTVKCRDRDEEGTSA